MQADEGRAGKRREQALKSGLEFEEVPLRKTVLLYGGGVLVLHDLAAVLVFLLQSVLHLFREPPLYELREYIQALKKSEPR